jgi:hypothetical protein
MYVAVTPLLLDQVPQGNRLPDGGQILIGYLESDIFRNVAALVLPFEPLSVSCPTQVLTKVITGSEMTMNLRYRPSLVMRHVTQKIRFVFSRADNDSYRWIPNWQMPENG